MDWETLRFSFLNYESIAEVYPLLLRGFWMTIKLCLLVGPLGFIAGMVLATIFSFHIRWLNWVLIAYVDFFRSIPPLVLLIYINYGLPMFGLDVPAFVAVLIAFTLNSSSYYGEIVRAGIESIQAGQMEAARSTGLNRTQAMIYVVLPQALRNVAPDLISNTLELIKATSIASVVALPELLRMARVSQELVFNATPLLVAAAIYLVMLWPIVRLLSRLERRMMSSH
ncbi:MAG: amino acid ABC transporter permease [Rhodospirillaceae bacterium]|nr:amino acid ABC transporter permease [Rhodospirillaceae bacterium]MBT6139990.1 amino acid ABC transporter permease [Rhodospirillaceae bacterium]